MIIRWIVLIIEKNTRRKIVNQILEYLKPKLIQQMKLLKNNKITKSCKKNDLKGGNPTYIHMTGKELLEQAFSNSFVENNQKDNTKFITKARKMVDNV